MRSTKKWHPEKFLAYALLYAAHADVRYKEVEKQYILTKVGPHAYDEAMEEFYQDNNYGQLQKILAHLSENKECSPGTVIKEMQEVCLADNHFHWNEKYMLSSVRRLLDNVLLDHHIKAN